MRTANVQVDLRIRAVSPEPMLFAHVAVYEGKNSAKYLDIGLSEGPGERTEILIRWQVRRAS